MKLTMTTIALQITLRLLRSFPMFLFIPLNIPEITGTTSPIRLLSSSNKPHAPKITPRNHHGHLKHHALTTYTAPTSDNHQNHENKVQNFIKISLENRTRPQPTATRKTTKTRRHGYHTRNRSPAAIPIPYTGNKDPGVTLPTCKKEDVQYQQRLRHLRQHPQEVYSHTTEDGHMISTILA